MGKIGNYELLFIIHPDLESSIDKILDQVRSSIVKRDGKINYEENWGKRKLAYEIEKNDVGIYVLCYFVAPKEKVTKIEKDLRLIEEVLRYMILSYEEVDEKKGQDEKADKKKEVTKSTKKETKKTKSKTSKKSERERMEQIDEKLGELLGKEDNDKNNPKGKEAKK